MTSDQQAPDFKAVIFDFGGVITSSPFDAFRRLEEARGLPANIIRAINAANPDDNAWARFERAEISRAAFDDAFAAEAAAHGVTLEGEAVLASLAGAVRPAMVLALDRLVASGYRIGCITNNVPSMPNGGHGEGGGGEGESIAAILARFEHVIESSKAGLRKPDPRIYLMMCEMLGLAPAQCVYLDDLGINCKPAAGLGMFAIKVTSEAQALSDLGTALHLAL